MWVWIIVFVVVVVVLVGLWIGNTVRWTKRNGNLNRKSVGYFRGKGKVDEQNRQVRHDE